MGLGSESREIEQKPIPDLGVKMVPDPDPNPCFFAQLTYCLKYDFLNFYKHQHRDETCMNPTNGTQGSIN